MKSHIVKIKSLSHVTHDVLRIVLEKPDNYLFTPGQATEIAINKKEWKKEKRPFTFTNLPDEDQLEFTIKTYPSHKGVTNELLSLKTGDELIIHEVWGAIAYKGEGVFIAGGAGVTPFLSIFRDLKSINQIGGNKLIFANKTKADIIHEKELKDLLCDGFINILSDEAVAGYAHGIITEKFLKENIDDFDKNFYICGPPPMMDAIQGYLTKLGVRDNSVVVEI
ncbi:flavodoxin reductase [Daejeonella sp.]|uniref:flavodoxin reductase n=1 Tax=Daejeonella sp. TaxID=2805397 RepID=UPI0039836DD1